MNIAAKTLFIGALAIVLSALVPGIDAAWSAEPVAGRWAGTVTEKSKKGDFVYTVYVKIAGDGASGSVQFLHYPCGGSLTLASKAGGKYLYNEALNFGEKLCLNNLQARIAAVGADEILFEELVNGAANVSGKLRKLH